MPVRIIGTGDPEMECRNVSAFTGVGAGRGEMGVGEGVPSIWSALITLNRLLVGSGCAIFLGRADERREFVKSMLSLYKVSKLCHSIWVCP